MAKAAPVHFSCAECGYSTGRWLGRCPGCGSFGTLAEEAAAAANGSAQPKPLLRLAEVEVDEAQRIETGVPELDHVLGGGLVLASLVLVGGEPGVGKSTLLLMALASISRERRALLVTGEESTAQVKLRAARLGGAEKVEILAETNLDAVCATLESERPDVCVIDSIQTLYSADVGSAPGSVAQVRECAAQLTRFAKQSGTTIVFIGHVTKEGALAGPRVLEHMVDTVLYFEGDTHSSFRLVRAIKNRFGAVNEIGVFAMTEKGLKGVANPSAIFLSTHGDPVAGTCVLVTLEGTRPLLVEVQALVDSGGPSPRRLSVGIERDRLAMMLAVLHRHAGIACHDQDVFINAVGGMKITEPAADLAVTMAIVSSLTNRALPARLVVFGEVGLAGEVRPVQRGQERLREAAKLGFTHALIPEANQPKQAISGLTVIAVRRVADAVAQMRDGFAA